MVRELHSRRILAPLVAVFGAALLTVTACGGSSSSASPPASSSAAGTGQRSPAPAVFGTIASATTGTLEVQDPQTGQTTVTYTTSTPVTALEPGTITDVVVGSCVVVTSASTSKSGSPVAATTVAITSTSAEGCTGRAEHGGPRGQGMTGTARKSAPPPKRKASSNFARPTIGRVTAVSGQGFTVAAIQRNVGRTSASGSSKNAPSKSTAAPKTTAVAITTVAHTTYTKTVTADAQALTVGKCLTASGKADDTGAVAATDLRVSTPGASGCSTGARGTRAGGPGARGNG